MQDRETKEIKNRAEFRASYTDKRFLLGNAHNAAVARHAARIKADTGVEPNWEEALENLIETHPATQHLFPAA
jgi:hypothetical protein